jgi:hypothetical protein
VDLAGFDEDGFSGIWLRGRTPLFIGASLACSARHVNALILKD